nr:hypothetical protein [uncultured Phycicoccus sp.]
MDIDATLAEQEDRLVGELATLTTPPEEMGSISFGKRIGEGTSMAVDRLAAVAVQEQLLDTLAQVRAARPRSPRARTGCARCAARRSRPAGSRRGRGPSGASGTPDRGAGRRGVAGRCVTRGTGG